MAVYKRKTAKILLFFLFLSLFTMTKHDNTKIYGDEVKGLESLAISLVIDQSGSMNDTDPTKMRETAANILIDLLSPEDYLGIISFSTEVIEVHQMANVGTATKAGYKSSVSGSLEAQGDTDYVKAFERAYAQLNSLEAENTKRVIIFLTDGDPDPDSSRREEEGFMDNYMNGFWEKIKEIGSSAYTVYSVGLGALDMEVMDRIAVETQGASSVYSNPSDIAAEFFDIISTLKNRNIFMDIEEEVTGEKVINFTMEDYVSQLTFVIRNLTGEINAEFVPPEGVNSDNVLQMVKMENYTLVTINQKGTESTGTWQMKLNGTSAVEVVGARDLFVKIWIDRPLTNTQHPIGEPIDISAILTGITDEEIEIQGIVMVNGVQALRPVVFTKDDDGYKGVFADTENKGSYEVIITAVSGENTIAYASATVHVKVLPSLTTDLNLSERGYIQGETRITMSSLSLSSTLLKESPELSIVYYELVRKNNAGDEKVFPLLDDGNIELGDVKGDDGRFSAVITFDEIGIYDYYLRARGTYKDEIFILERNLGKTEVFPPGSVKITPIDSAYETLEGEDVELTFAVRSTSHFQERITLVVEETHGVLSTNTITVEPLEEKEVTVRLVPKNKETGEITVPIRIMLENELTEVSAGTLSFSIITTSKLARLTSTLRSYSSIIIIVLFAIALVLLLVFLIGMFLYHKRFKLVYFMDGKVYISKNNQTTGVENESEISLNAFNKPKVVFTFDSTHKTIADHFIEGSKYEYDVIFEKSLEKSRYRFIDGYKSIKMSSTPPKVYIRTTSPGILLIEGEVHTKMEVEEQAVFSSGEYHFRYIRNLENKEVKEGKNILEGRM